MLPIIIAVITVAVGVTLWIISVQRKLVMLDENISNAMCLIGVQLSSRFDALMFILDLVKSCSRHESETLIDSIKSVRCMIMGKSTSDDVLRQEKIISEVLGRIAEISERHPEVKANRNFIRAIDAMQTLENMLRTSRLIYNDSVAKLNREIRMFPVSMIAGVLGFRQRDYLTEKMGREHSVD